MIKELVVMKYQVTFFDKENKFKPVACIIEAENRTEIAKGQWKDAMKNDFEKSVFAKHPSMEKIKEELYAMGAVYASMSGSGSAFFGIFNSECNIEMLKAEYPNMFCQQWKL